MDIDERDGVAIVSVPEDWRDTLEWYRENTNELEEARKQEQRYAEQRRNVRRRDEHQPDKEPKLMERANVERIIEERRWIEEQRQKVAMTATVFLAD